MDRVKFDALIRLLALHGADCVHMTKTTEECVLDTHEFITKGSQRSGSCINTAPFVVLLFSDLEVNPNGMLDQLWEYPSYDDFQEESFEDMTNTWFSIDNELGSHECNLIYISSEEIYFIDLYMETERDKMFRVIKFTSYARAVTLINEALFLGNEKAFDELFDFQPSAEKDRYNVSTSCRIFKIKSLPDFERLWEIFNQSAPILENDLKEQIERAKKIDFNLEYWGEFLRTSNYDFMEAYQKSVTKLNLIYDEYIKQLSVLSNYYTVL